MYNQCVESLDFFGPLGVDVQTNSDHRTQKSNSTQSEYAIKMLSE